MAFLTQLWSAIKNGVTQTYASIITNPLFRMYLHAPALWWGMGGWEGREMADICSHRTSVSAHFWQQPEHTDTCEKLILQQFNRIFVPLEILLHFFIVFICVRWILAKYTTPPPPPPYVCSGANSPTTPRPRRKLRRRRKRSKKNRKEDLG